MHYLHQLIIPFKLISFSSTVVASQLIEDSTCDLTSKDQSCITATTSTAARLKAQDFSGQTSKSLPHNTPIKRSRDKLCVHKAQKIRRRKKILKKNQVKK